LRVQPRTKPIRNDMPAAVPATQATGLNDIHQTPNPTQPQSRIRPAQSTGWSRPREEAPVAPGVAYSERDLSRLCDTGRLRVEDLRDRNGNLWVLTGDTDGYVSGQLRSWGFSFKAGKGWWRK
jgi:hypothetical protein